MSPSLRIALAPGDGIGPEIMAATIELFAAAGVSALLDFVPISMGKGEFDKGNSRGISEDGVRLVEDCGVLFKGPMETPKGGGGKSINVTARKLWSAYANLRTFRSLPGVDTVFSKAGVKINMTIVRENIEDTYGGVERRLSPDMFEGKRLLSAPGSEEVCRFAFETAKKMGLTKVHCGHKANIMKMTDGIFLDRFRAVARDYPQIEPADVIVDALCMNLTLKPQQYQMIVLPNLQGDIVSDLAAGLVGGLGFAPSANIGKHISIFEAVHGTAPDIAGRGIANPAALILSGLSMLRHLSLFSHAANIENALLAALEQGVHTGDFGGGGGASGKPALNTRDFVKAIADRLGTKPSVGAVAVPAEASTRAVLNRPEKPQSPTLIRTFANTVTQFAGVDIYVDSTEPPAKVAQEMQRLAEGTPFKLTILSNRGTQVWPTGSVYTECVDYFRARFEGSGGAGDINQSRCLALLSKIAEKFTVSSYEPLRVFDGVKGYSMAQGQ